MKLYIDLIFILNFLFDLILLSTVSVILRRNIKIYKLVLGALVGALSIFILFLPITGFGLFIFKIIVSVFMVLTTFGYKDIRYFIRNSLYLYSVSMILGGFLYFLNIEFSYKQKGLVFFFEGLSVNYIFLLIAGPLIIYLYVRQAKQLKNNYSNYYDVDIYLKNGSIKKVSAFLDTGNNLYDPYKNRPIILVESIEIAEDDMLLVPFDTINNHGLLRCTVVDKIDILGEGIRRDVLVGISDKKIKMDGVECILHSKLLEG